MARTTLVALTLCLPVAAIGAAVVAQSQAPAQAPPAKPITSAAGRAQDSGINSDTQVPYDPTQPQGSQDNSDVQVPIGQAPPAQANRLPPNAGFNNSGGIVDSSTLTQQALDGTHYHYHYYGPGSFVSSGPTPGYAKVAYENPATASGPTNPYLTPMYGPGNPAPMNTLCMAKPTVRCSSGSRSATKARKGSMLTFTDASRIQRRPAAIHSTPECGMARRASEASMAPTRK